MTLKAELDKFGQLFGNRLNGAKKATLRWVTATAVNWGEQTMTAEDGDGLEFFNVLLGVGTMSVKPVIGTDCLIAIVEGDEATAFLLYADNADLIEFNGGENGGLVKLMPLAEWMQKVSSDLQTLKTLLQASPVAGNGAPLAIVFNPQSPAVIQQTDFENEKITH